jgi:hypothetical protein
VARYSNPYLYYSGVGGKRISDSRPVWPKVALRPCLKSKIKNKSTGSVTQILDHLLSIYKTLFLPAVYKRRVFLRTWPWWHPDLRVAVFRTLRNVCCLDHPLCCILLQQSELAQGERSEDIEGYWDNPRLCLTSIFNCLFLIWILSNKNVIWNSVVLWVILVNCQIWEGVLFKCPNS